MTDCPYSISPELENNADDIKQLSKWTCSECGYTNYSLGADVLCKNCTAKMVRGDDPAMEPSHKLGKLSRSKGEERITDVLNELGIEFEIEKSFPTCKDKLVLRFDFYLPEYNMLIEYDGIHHTEPVKWSNDLDVGARFELVKKHDILKDSWAKDNGYNLIRITNKQFKHIDKLINFWVDLAISDALKDSEALLEAPVSL